MKLCVGLVVVLAGAGCARPAAPRQPPSEDAALQADDACARCSAAPSSNEAPETPRYAPSRTLAIESPEAEPQLDRWAVRRIGGDSASDDAAPRPKRARKVDIDLVQAPFEDVARFLGDTGRFNVVVEAPSARPVTVKLRDIEPYDALVAISEVQGIGVTYRRGVVIVSNGAK